MFTLMHDIACTFISVRLIVYTVLLIVPKSYTPYYVTYRTARFET